MPATAKKTKQESTSPVTRTEAVIQDKLKNGFGPSPGFAPLENKAFGVEAVSHVQVPPTNEAFGQKLYASPPVYRADSIGVKDARSMSASSPTASLVSPPTSLADEMDVMPDGEALASVEGEATTALQTPNTSSRHSSRQPRHVERFAPEVVIARAPKAATGTTSSKMRPTTPGALPASTKKPSSRPSSSHAKKSSPMVERRFDRHLASSLSPHQTSKHTRHHAAEDGLDAESLRLIRELQEEEFGLRRRSTRG